MHADLTSSVIFGLGWLYLVLFLMNITWAYRSFQKKGHCKLPEFMTGVDVPTAAFWAIYSSVLLVVSVAHFTGYGSPETFSLRLPDFFKATMDQLMGPVTYFTFSVLLFVLMILLREWLIKPTVAWLFLNGALLFLAASMTDYDFRQIVGKPDNVPIVAMLFIVGFFTWIYFSRAVDNDNRIAEGRPLFENEENEKILVWPDLVYPELICMIVITTILIVWGMVLQAPLEEAASAVKTPNPSKAPWYFLGLQEMLVYFDPWLAGVVYPSVILGGLIALPYIDFNKKGNGYYTFKERWFAVSTFLFGFFPLWIALIVLGTFLRGPNWNIFGIYEYWDVHKVEVLNNVNLSEMFWVYSPWGNGIPAAAPGSGEGMKGLYYLYRELPGFILIGVYLFALPPLMAATIFRKFYHRMGFVRFMVFSNLVLLMISLPIKMLLRWSINLKYIVSIPEWLFNI
ncbi:Cytochrome b [hydrothermal vent metagenome]|uniref:Cytochrome b n=1 Tax=hydrothermal vent metagenome TaxID=652676 RepID=A0A3B1DS12_9ZZZZ